MMSSWIYLFTAGFFEIGFTTFMKLSDGFTVIMYTAGFVMCAGLSFYCLNKSLSTIPLGTAYAVWTGIGAFGTAVIGMVFFKDPVSTMRTFFLLLLIASNLGLKLVSLK
jgi:quaternary ammonium compound-resistance protein SugE